MLYELRFRFEANPSCDWYIGNIDAQQVNISLVLGLKKLMRCKQAKD